MTRHNRHTDIAPVATMTTAQPSDALVETIRQRAYELFERRGREHGHDFDDWITAELELNQQTKTQAA